MTQRGISSSSLATCISIRKKIKEGRDQRLIGEIDFVLFLDRVGGIKVAHFKKGLIRPP